MPIRKLRQDTVKTLPYVGAHHKQQCIYWDDTLESFGVRVYASGRRTYVYTYRVNRRKRLARLGRVDALSLEQARKKASVCLAKVASNEDPQAVSDAVKAAITVEQLVTRYVEGYARPQQKMWREIQSSLSRNLLPKFRLTLARNLNSADIAPISVLIGIERPYAANHFLDAVRRMYNWAKRPARLVPADFENPASGIQRFPKRRRRRFITTVEMPKFIRALEQDESDYSRHAMWLLLLTGMRMREVLKAKWEHVDWDMGTLFVGLTKNGEPLLAPLCEAALIQLRMIPRTSGNPYIICGRDPGTHLKDLRSCLCRIRKRADMPDIRVHDLRRTVGSWLAQAGTSLHLIGDVLNHLDTSTTAGYAYFQTQHRRDALSGHAEKVLRLAAPHMLELTKVQSLTPAGLLSAPNQDTQSGPNQATKQHHYFTREALYKLVWTAPVLELAGRLGVSDMAISKLCQRTRIPIPYRGYWARLEAGQPMTPTPLPPAPEGLTELLRIRGNRVTPIADRDVLKPVEPVSQQGASMAESAFVSAPVEEDKSRGSRLNARAADVHDR